MTDIPFNMSFVVGPDLRERPRFSEEMRLGVAWLRDRLKEAEIQVRDGKAADSERATPQERTEKRLTVARLNSLLGSYLRMLGDLDESEAALKESLRLFEREYPVDVAESIAAKIRLAHTLQWKRRFEEADELFEICIVTCGRDPRLMPMRDFAFQHYGKSKFDQGRYGRALEMFEAALRLRDLKADPALITSTLEAIDFTRDRIRDQASRRSPTM